MNASEEIIIQAANENDEMDKKVDKGETVYNKDEYEIAKSVTDAKIAKDLAEGRVSKYYLKLMNDPKSLPYWEQ